MYSYSMHTSSFICLEPVYKIIGSQRISLGTNNEQFSRLVSIPFHIKDQPNEGIFKAVLYLKKLRATLCDSITLARTSLECKSPS